MDRPMQVPSNGWQDPVTKEARSFTSHTVRPATSSGKLGRPMERTAIKGQIQRLVKARPY